MNFQEAMALFNQHKALHEANGVTMNGVKTYLPDEFKHNYELAMDAQPALVTDPNGGIPAYLTTMVDPQVYRVAFAPTKGAEVLGEVRKGSWLDETAMFPVIEHTGEVSSYGDYNENGRVGANMNWPQRQAYLFQTIEEYGDRELERAGLARISWAGELDVAAANVLNRFLNFMYHFGVAGLQNYGLLNDPNLSAALTPSTKAAGGTRWILANNATNATPNEVYADFQALFNLLNSQTGGLLDPESKMTLVIPSTISGALTITNSFGISVKKMISDAFPNVKIVTDPLYGAQSATNPQGVVGGNYIQLIADEVDGQDTGYAAFNEKMRSFPIVRGTSSYKKKVVSGGWGAVIRMPAAVASMVGV